MDGRESFTPDMLRHPWPLVPVCIISLTLGMYLTSFMLFPTYYPAVTTRIADGHWTSRIVIISFFCVSLPIALLKLATSESRPS